MTIKSLVPYQAVALIASGLTGATAASRYVGGTATGAPSSGTFVTGDMVVAQNGHIWICTAGGTPGTWTDASAGVVSSVAGRTGAVVLTAADVGAGTFPGANTFSSSQTFSGGVVANSAITGSGTIALTGTGASSVAGTFSPTACVPTGLTGSTAATRYVGGTTTGAPTTGAHNVGDWVITQDGHIFICTAAGTPGTWANGGASVTAATSVTSETTYGIASAVGTSTNYARQDHTHGTPATPVTSAVAGTGIGVSGATGAVTISNTGALLTANTFSGLQTFNAGITVPAGQALTTGTRSVVTGARTTTTNASDTVDLGTFSTTGGAMELRIHAHLAAPAAGTTASVTKVYEIAAGALMGTASTWYLCLPVDTSAAAASTNDFALEVNRTATGTFQFRFRQKSIGIAGAIIFTVETLGDTVVTFTPSTTVTAAPAAVSTLHPSNALISAAGNVGVGMDPTFPLDVNGTMRAVTVMEGANRVYSAGNANLSAATPAAVASTGAVGTSAVYSRDDHAHSGVTTVSGRAGAVTLTAADVGAGTFPGAYTVSSNLTVNGILSGQSSAGSPNTLYQPINPGSASYSNAAAWIYLNGTSDTTNSPRLGFHLAGVVASQIGMDRSGQIRTYDNPGTGYANFLAGSIFDNNNRVYSASNTPPYPVTSISGLTGTPEVGRGIQQLWDQTTTAGSTTTSSTSEQSIFSGVGSFTFVSGRRYRLHLSHHGHCGTASTSGTLLFQVRLGAFGTGGAVIGMHYLSPATTGQQTISAVWEMACTADLAAGTFGVSLTVTAQGTANSWAPAGASGNIGERTKIWLEDIGT